MDFNALQNRTKLWLNFNSGQDDQDFSATDIMAYSEEVTRAKQEGTVRWFRALTETTWEADEVTFTVPVPLNRIAVLRIIDVTNSVEPGTSLLFSEEGATGEVFWRDRNTLQWGSTGPSEDKTLRFVYVASSEELVNDNEVPELIPDEFHELIPLSAAILLRQMADEAAPVAWLSRQEDYRLQYWKFVSRGRPLADIPSVDPFDADLDLGVP
jgi:hypothetical protein